MGTLELLLDLHLRNDRQGPGCDEETRRAVELARLDPALPIEAADLGCGTGASALVLARALNARVTALDAAEPFVARLRERAAGAGLADRIEARVGQMESPPFRERSLDLIWSEGAIYNMGFGAGLRAWRPFLRAGGVLAVSELSWTSAQRPPEVEAHWTREYPGIRTVAENLGTLEREGYHPLACFVLPEPCWEQNYYAPLRAGFAAFLDRHAGDPDAAAIVAAEQAEMTLRARHGAWYGYAFYIARRGADSEG
jgi:SAM-dependent methyltransferase